LADQIVLELGRCSKAELPRVRSSTPSRPTQQGAGRCRGVATSPLRAIDDRAFEYQAHIGDDGVDRLPKLILVAIAIAFRDVRADIPARLALDLRRGELQSSVSPLGSPPEGRGLVAALEVLIVGYRIGAMPAPAWRLAHSPPGRTNIVRIAIAVSRLPLQSM
jgi:hypothetical protein